MENQLIRGQVFDVLFNYAEKWGSICTESDCATVRDEICLRIDQSQFTADEAEEHINQEVERRIAERMPSDELIEEIQEKSLLEYENAPICEIDYYSGFEDGVKWLRSRLTNQKTEGGGE
jgi:hypothetical protein